MPDNPSLISARRQARIREQLRDAVNQVRTLDAGMERDKQRTSIRQYLAIDEVDALLSHVLNVERKLRYEWWIHHGCDFIALYGDDGEMSCGSCFTDFKRMPLDELDERVVKLKMARAAKAVAG